MFFIRQRKVIFFDSCRKECSNDKPLFGSSILSGLDRDCSRLRAQMKRWDFQGFHYADVFDR